MVAAALLVCWSKGTGAVAGVEGNEYLDLDLGQLMNITVSSVAKRDQRLSDAAAAVFVITQEDIHRSGVTTIPDALAMAPGIQVAKISASKWSVSSRGFSGFTSNKLLVLIDGRSVYSPAYSGVFWDAQNVMLEDVSRIEVIRGPGGTLWGANAVNGVINIITKKSQETEGGLVRASLGDRGEFSGASRYGGKISETAFARAYVLSEQTSSNRLAESGVDGNDAWRPKQTGFRMDGKPGSLKEWTLQGDLYDNSADQTLYPFWTQDSVFPSSLDNEVHAKGGNLLGRWRQEFGDGQALTLKTYYDQNQRNDALFNLQFATIDLDLQYESKLGSRQNLTTGVGYRSIQGSFDETYRFYLPDRQDDLYSGFLQDEINLVADRLWLTLGTKYEHNEYTGSEWQPSAKLLWKPAPGHSLWTSVARAVRTPSIVEQYGRVLIGQYAPEKVVEGVFKETFPAEMETAPFEGTLSNQGSQDGRVLVVDSGSGRVVFLGNTDFASEVVDAYEAGYRWQATESLSMDLALFHNEYRKIYTIVPQDISMEAMNARFVNGQSGSGNGLELELDWKARSWLTFALAYSHLENSFSPDPVLGGPDKDWLSNSSPKDQVSLRSSIALAPHWRLNLWVRYVDSILCSNSYDLTGQLIAVDDSMMVNANLIWSPSPNLEIMLAGENLADSGQVQYLSEFQTPATEIQRRVFGKLTWRF